MFVYLQSQNRSYRSELPARRVGRSVRSFEIFAIRDVPKDERSAIWSDGRVARQRSAKPCTAVRIRFRPHRNRVVDVYNAVFILFCHTFVIHLSYICHTRRADDAFEVVCTYTMNRSNLSFQRRQSGISVSSREKKAAVWSGCSR